jgi:gas vesicle protein
MGRFVLGFIIGSAAVVLLTPKSGSQAREGIATQINTALEAGKQAAALREEELWDQYRSKLKASLDTKPTQQY